ncbi:type VI secretion system ATPase TssH, partial [Vibrio parahaemolyticus]|nr:type VI secretion system ATPase TssH [Vibrio parahaemolyticus]
KAVSVLDTACSRVALSQSSTPGGLDAKRNKLKAKQAEYEHLSQENRLGASLDVQLQSVRKEIDALSNDIIELEVLWEKEKEWVSEAKSLRTQIIQEGSETARDKLQELENNLSANSQPLVFSHVNEALIAEVISDWTGIPLGKLQDDEIQAVLGLKESLCKRVVGQDHALELMSEVIKT